MKVHRQSNPGFTLVELLVVIAIIGVLVALLLPAVQAAREAARRMHCSNNLKQLGLAVQLFEDTAKTYPSGAYWVDPDLGVINQGTLLMRLLPYVEQQNLYDLYDFDLDPAAAVPPGSGTDFQTLPGGTELIGATRVEAYVCPSNPHPEYQRSGAFESGFAMANYAGSRGPCMTPVNGGAPCSVAANFEAFALNTFFECEGSSEFSFPGVFSRIVSHVTPRQVTDGLSNTIFIGETRPDCSIHAAQGWARSNNASGIISTVPPINFDSCIPENAPDACQQWDNWTTSLGFKSSHPGGAQFVFGDGSVHFLQETIDHQAYQFLGAKSDDQTVNINGL